MPVNVIPVLSQSKAAAQANAKVLDHISATRLSRSPKPSTTPISKQILTAIFSTLPKSQKHVFVENDQENHSLYGLVLPLVARVLAVSTPGLLVIVQLPRPDVVPAWAVPTYDGYGSNGSGSASKSAAPTTPSPEGTSRTPSPSDDVPSNARKSLSPDTRPPTEQLIRHADNFISTESRKLVDREDRSPPPDSVVQDHAALRLICNGFEVLTGKMPPPTYDMGAFTLASVAWEKAGVLEPEDPNKDVSMSFSNGMMTPTEGIVVTFSNGSLCLLTTRDPLAGLDSLKVAPETPVVVFSFAAVGYASVADLLAMKPDSLSPVAGRVREHLEKPNFFFVEIGHSGALPNTSMADCDGEAQASASDGKRSANEEKNRTDTQDSKADKTTSTCPPILISSVPRAVPLFVNTINQTIIDPPHYEQANDYEQDAANDRFPDRLEASREEQENRPASGPEQRKRSNQPMRRHDTTENKEDTERKGAGASSPTPETSKPFNAVDSQPSKPLPPVHEVVRMSQGIPAGHGHHAPVYNYPYPPGHMYASNPKNHHVVPHHVAPMHQGQSMGNPYYIPSHASGHTGHAAQYQAKGYAPNGYYPQHVVPGHDSWHRAPQYHGMPQHPLEARPDVPAQFGHGADGQYGNCYYPPMPHGDIHRSQHMGAAGATPLPVGLGPPRHNGSPGARPTSAPGGERAAVHRPAEVAGKQAVNVGEGQEQENALKALMHMRSRATNTRREGSAEAHTKRRRDGSVVDGNGGSDMNREVDTHVRRSRRGETSSSTSTNSGGCALVNGAVVGHSNAKSPRQKRRKR